MIHNRHPIIGQAYTVLDPDALLSGEHEPDVIVPIGYDDLGNCQVDVYGSGPMLDDGPKTMLWNDDALAEHYDDCVIRKESDES